MNVYMVHRESGEYSDWTYDVQGIFSSYEKARDYLERTERFRFNVGKYKNDDDGWYTDEDYMHYEIHDVASLLTTDGRTFMYRVAGSDLRVFTWDTNETYYITEYELDGRVE